jgi:hypothetical protein
MEKIKIPGLFLQVIPFLFSGLILFIIYYPAITAPAGHALFGDDFFRSYGFFRQLFKAGLDQGSVPFWNPYLFSGTPLLANPSVAYLYPPNWLYSVLPVYRVYLILVLFHLWWAMAGMSVLIAKIAGKQSLAARLFGATAFGLSGYFSARIWAGHGEIIAAASWLPWVFTAFYLLFKGYSNKRLVVAAATLALQILSGYQTISLFTLEAVGLAGLIFIVSKKDIRVLLSGIAAVILGMMLAAGQLFPAFEYFGHSIRTYDFGYDWAARGAWTLDTLIQFVRPFALGDQRTFSGPPPNYHEQAVFAGAVTLLLAAAAAITVAVKKKRQFYLPVIVFAAVVIISLFVSMGPNFHVNIHGIIYDFLPLYRNIRFPARHGVLVAFGLATLGSIGVAFVRHRLAQVFLLAVLLVEMLPFARHFVEVKLVPGSQHDQALVTKITKDKKPYRTLQNFGVGVAPRDALDFDAVMVYRIFSATGYDPSILKDYYDFVDLGAGNPDPSVLNHDVQVPLMDIFSPAIDFLNIKYLVVPTIYDPASWYPGVKYKLIREDLNRGYRLYENQSPLPRFFLVWSVTILPDREAVRQVILNRTADLSQTILLNSQTDLPFNAPDPDCQENFFPEVITKKYALNEIILETTASCAAYLSTSEVMYPGWRAQIDGTNVPVLTANLAFRALAVPAGKHEIRFKFIPASLFSGGLVSFLALAFAIRLWLYSSRSS